MNEKLNLEVTQKMLEQNTIVLKEILDSHVKTVIVTAVKAFLLFPVSHRLPFTLAVNTISKLKEENK
jgi:hypothetical protein